MTTRSQSKTQTQDIEEEITSTIKKSSTGNGLRVDTIPIRPFEPIILRQEELEIKEIFDDKTAEDQIPIYIRREQDQIFNSQKMCRFYAHHLTCQEEIKKG
jgi:hypothetical protein